MKTILAIAFVASALIPARSLFAQGGSLTPPGAPAPTMMSLDEMEPRTPLVGGAPGVSVGASGTITITQSGSYYLTGNLTVTSGSGIIIGAGGVTLDLRGFTITSTAATPTSSSAGVNIDASNVAVFNGHIVSGTTYDSGAMGDQFTGTGFEHGIYAFPSTFRNIRVRDVSVQGCDNLGISILDTETSIVEGCTVRTVGSIGIRAATVRGCTVAEAGGNGIQGASVSDSRAESVGSDGISASNVRNCYGVTFGTSSSADGIDAGRSVENSYGQSTAGDGIQGENVMNSRGFTNGDDGIQAAGNVLNCRATTTGTGTNADGISASFNVMNSYGQSAGDDGIDTTYTISYSRGNTSGTGVGLECGIAIGCTSVGGQTIANKYLMP